MHNLAALSTRVLVRVVLAACIFGALWNVAAYGSRAAPHATQMTVLYSSLTDAAFVNNRDDRARGEGNNPFGNFRGSAAASTNERTLGPLPGDEGLFTYDLYTTANLTKASVGSALFICQYNFSKNGFCNISYQLSGGSLVGVGAFNSITAKTFVLSITGGTGNYRSDKGTVTGSRNTAVPTQESLALSHVIPSLALESQRLVVSIKTP